MLALNLDISGRIQSLCLFVTINSISQSNKSRVHLTCSVSLLEIIKLPAHAYIELVGCHIIMRNGIQVKFHVGVCGNM